MYSYKYKAELNNEAYTIIGAFKPMKPFKFIILTTEKEVEDFEDQIALNVVTEMTKVVDGKLGEMK